MSSVVSHFNVLTTTANQLSDSLENGRLTSVQIVKQYLQQISRHNRNGLKLHAIISTAPEDVLLAQAQQLDTERAEGRTRSPLHGIPIIVKDAFVTPAALGMPTTAGAVAFEDCYGRENAGVIAQLLSKGLLIIAKASMTEFCGLKATCMTAGWSAVNGQTQSAYIEGGVKKEDLFMGRSTPGGSSSGSAVGVSAGFAPLGLGTETSGSVCMPANRAGLYSIKMSHGSVPADGMFSLSREFDCVGGMAKCPEDLALLVEVLKGGNTKTQDEEVEQVNNQLGYADGDSPSVGFVDPKIWDALQFQRSKIGDVERRITTAYDWAMAQIQERGGKVVYPVDLPESKALQYEGKRVLFTVSFHQFTALFEEFCLNLQDPQVRSVRELVEFNEKHAARAMLIPHTDQTDLLKTLDDSTTDATAKAAIAHARRLAGPDGIDRALKTNAIDVIVGPGDCSICVVAALAGYPTAMVPLGVLEGELGMGQPQGLMLVGAKGEEGKLLEFMSFWERLIGSWKVPPLFKPGDE